jgi:hypothetical protein
MNHVHWGLVGQVLTVWLIAACILGPIIGRFLRSLRVETTRPVALPRDPMKYEGRDLSPAQIEKARSLGFLDDDSPRAA